MEQVRRANADFYAAFESLSIERMAAVWAHDGQVCCIHPAGSLAEGWEAVRASWAAMFANTESIKFSVSDERIDVRGELAWVVCVERISSVALGARTEASSLTTNVFRRDPAGWRLVHHHASPFVASAPRAERTLGPRKVLN